MSTETCQNAKTKVTEVTANTDSNTEPQVYVISTNEAVIF